MNLVKKLVELDGRRRASLGVIAHPDHSRYLAHAEPNGTIIMTPVDVVPAVVGVKPGTLEPTAAEQPRDLTDGEDATRRGLSALRRLRDNPEPSITQFTGKPDIISPFA